MNRVFLSLGSNLGDKDLNLKKAIELIRSNNNISNIKISSFYKTAPQGYVMQDEFVNCAVGFDTLLNPFELLSFCQSIESKLKRVRLFRWGPRVIDVDILLFNKDIINDENLIIPHPRMYERGFVLVPLAEINSEINLNMYNLEGQEVIKI